MSERSIWLSLVPAAAKIVPASGISAWLTVTASAAIVFVTTLALAFAFAVGRAADEWRSDVQSGVTLRIEGPPDRLDGLEAQAIAVLETTPGIGSFDVMGAKVQEQLLEPWIAASELLPELDLPRLITITPDDQELDVESLSLRLEAEVPGATLVDHAEWVAPLAQAADRISRFSAGAGALALFALTAMTVLSVQAAMAANRHIIATLRLLGAYDSFIAGAFILRLTWRAILGAAIGVGSGMAMLYLVPVRSREQGIFARMGFEGPEWAAPLLLIPLVGAIAFGTTYIAAHFLLKRLN